MDERYQQLLRDVQAADQDELHYEAAQPLMQLCAAQKLPLAEASERYPALGRLLELDADARDEYGLMLALNTDEAQGRLVRPKSIPNRPPLKKPTQPRRRILALPLSVTAATRSGTDSQSTTVWRAASIRAEVSLRTVAVDEGVWKVEGYVTSDDKPVVGAAVHFSSTQSPHSTITEAGGFFDLTDVAEGTWTLSVSLADGLLVVNDIVLLEA